MADFGFNEETWARVGKGLLLQDQDKLEERPQLLL